LQWEDANEARRNVTQRAALTSLNASELRVLLAVLALTTEWNKVAGRISLVQVADLAGFRGTYESRSRRVRKALQSMAEKELVVYVPGRSRARAGLPIIGINYKPCSDQDGVGGETEDTNPVLDDFEPRPISIRTPSSTGQDPRRSKDSSNGENFDERTAQAQRRIAEERDLRNQLAASCRLCAEDGFRLDGGGWCHHDQAAEEVA
jgi:hypothetical protein